MCFNPSASSLFFKCSDRLDLQKPLSADRVVVGVAGALPAAALHPQGFFVTNRALELAEARDVLPLALGLIAIGADLATDPRGCHHLSKFVDLLVRPAACLLLRVSVSRLCLCSARRQHHLLELQAVLSLGRALTSLCGPFDHAMGC